MNYNPDDDELDAIRTSLINLSEMFGDGSSK